MANLSRRAQKNLQTGENESLWNIAISPGWSALEIKILKLAVMKYGMGKWTALHNS
jgi:hypothetical protein